MKMGIPWRRRRRSSTSSDGQDVRNLQEGLWQIGSQAFHILVHADNNNLEPLAPGRLMEVTRTGGSAREQQQLLMLIPHSSSTTSSEVRELGSDAKKTTRKNKGGCGRLDGVPDETDFELWDSRFTLRGDHDPDFGFKHVRWGPRGWCKPSCIPITIILILIVLVVLLPLMDQKEFEYFLKMSHKCPQTCSFTLVESIPEGLTYPKGSHVHVPTFNVWLDLIKSAQLSISIASFYWSLQTGDVLPGDPSSSEKGDTIFQSLLAAGRDRNINVRIARSIPSDISDSNDTDVLAKEGKVQVRDLNFTRLMGAGVLHTKLWIIDNKHIYVGSANMDWRSLTQVKELGVAIYNCSCLANDLAKIFEVYWLLGVPNAEIPSTWPEALGTKYNIEHPATVLMNGSTNTELYITSSPKPLCPTGRTADLEAISDVMAKAESFIHIAVMDYFPLLLYTENLSYWPVIDNALRAAAVDHKIQVRLLISHWKYSHHSEKFFLKSLQDITHSYPGVSIEVKLFKVPAIPGQEIPYTRVNHNKYMVTDNTAFIGTSNWSGDYFVNTAGVSIVVHNTEAENGTIVMHPLVSQLQQVFERDWNSIYAYPLESTEQ